MRYITPWKFTAFFLINIAQQLKLNGQKVQSYLVWKRNKEPLTVMKLKKLV